jgi:hypothetical protein
VPERFASARRIAKTAGRAAAWKQVARQPGIGDYGRSAATKRTRTPTGSGSSAVEGDVSMRNIAIAAAMIGVLLASTAQASEDPKAQKRRDARQIDEQYQHATKGSSWAVSPKPLADPWQTVKSPPPPEKK